MPEGRNYNRKDNNKQEIKNQSIAQQLLNFNRKRTVVNWLYKKLTRKKYYSNKLEKFNPRILSSIET